VSETVMDASAVLAAVRFERGHEVVLSITGTACISAVNYAEVRSRLTDYGLSRDEIDDSLGFMPMEIVDFDAQQAVAASELRSATRSAGLSLGDRACLALAMVRNAVALTADRAWQKAEVPIQIEYVR